MPRGSVAMAAGPRDSSHPTTVARAARVDVRATSWPAPASAASSVFPAARSAGLPRRRGPGTGTTRRLARGATARGPGGMSSSSLRATAANRWWKRNQSAVLVERHDEQVRAFELVEDRCGVADARDVVAQGRREPIQDRDRADEVPHPVGVPVEHLLGQVVADEAVPPAEAAARSRRRRVRPASDSVARYSPAGQPSVRSISCGTVRRRDLDVVVGQQLPGLVRGEAEVDRHGSRRGRWRRAAGPVEGRDRSG